MSRDEKQFEKEGSLMSDEMFAKFMEAKFKKENPPQNEVEKIRSWNEVSKNISPSKPINQQKWLPFASVALLVLAILPTLFVSNETDITRIKGENQYFAPVINIAKLNPDGSLNAVDTEIQVGDTLVFKALVQQESIIALALQTNSNKASIRFISQPIDTDKPRLLKRDKITYGYLVEDKDKTLTFCLIAATNTKRLEHRVSNLLKIWKTLPQDSCKTLKIR